MTLNQLPQRNGTYNVSSILPELSWVNQEQAELLLLEYNSGVE